MSHDHPAITGDWRINSFAFNATLPSGPLFKGHCIYAS